MCSCPTAVRRSATGHRAPAAAPVIQICVPCELFHHAPADVQNDGSRAAVSRRCDIAAAHDQGGYLRSDRQGQVQCPGRAGARPGCRHLYLLVSTRLETARLVIRTFQARDADPSLSMVTDPEVRRFLPAGPAPTIELAQRIIGERQVMERELGHTMWAVEDKTTGTFVGQCGLRPVDEGAGPEIDLAYHYIRASWNKGYATEAAIAVIGHGLGPVGLAAIMAVVVLENIGSWRGHGEGGHALPGARRLLRHGRPEEVPRRAGVVEIATCLMRPAGRAARPSATY